MKIVAVGDIGIHGRLAAWVHSDPESLIGPTRPLLSGADLVLGNLELPIAPPGMERLAPATGAAPAAAARLLRDWGFTHICLANNHVMDLGEEGLRFTIAALREVGISPFGAGADDEEAGRPLLLDGDPPLALLGYSMRCRANAETSRPGSARFLPLRAERSIRDLREAGRAVVVSLHLGRMYLRRPSPHHRRQVIRLLDAGASLVLCHHSHVPAGILRRGAGVAALGLGEFAFDPHQGEIRTIVGRRSREIGVLVRAESTPDRAIHMDRVAVRRSASGGPEPHPLQDSVLRDWRRWDRELARPELWYRSCYYLAEYPRLLAYVCHAALIHAGRGNWRKVYAYTLGLLVDRFRHRRGGPETQH